MIKFEVISSGSKGNCYILDDGESKLLIECGVNYKDIQKALDFRVTSLDGLLLTHSHKDHSKSLKEILKAGVNCYMTEEEASALNIQHNRVRHIAVKKPFFVGSYKIMAFDTEHDTPNSVGFLITNRQGDKFLFATDTYYIRYVFPGLTHIAIEVNYSEDIINRNVDLGRCAPSLRKRIRQSHMSLETAIDFFRVNDLSKVEMIYLLHLSDSNSDERIFKKTIQGITGKPVIIA